MQQNPGVVETRPVVQSHSGTITPSYVRNPQDLRADFDTTAHPIVLVQQANPPIVSEIGPEPDVKEPPYQHVTPNEATIREISRGSRQLPQSPAQALPRDTHSFESFTKSQEGDDERSEDSVPATQGHPPRASSLYLKGLASQRQSRYPHTLATTEDNAPIFVKERPVVNSGVGSPKEVQTPRSTTSSNKTPTQATFTDADQPAVPAAFPVTINRTSVQQKGDAAPSPSFFSQPQSGFSAQNLSSNSRGHEPEAVPRFSQDSEGTFHTATSEDGLPEPSLPLQNTQSISAGLDTYSQDATDMTMPHQSEALQGKITHSPTETPYDRTVFLTRESLNPETPSQHNHSWRGPSIDSDLGRTTFDHPPSPLTPRQPTNYGTLDQRGRTGPIHYGIDHDFDRPSDTERSRSRSPSYSRQRQDIRRSQDSRPSLDPNILEHPAFRAVAQGNGMPAEDYGGQLTREVYIPPHQQTAEHMIVGGGPTVGRRRSNSKSRSRRGSRSSAFFKAFTSPSKPDHPPLPNAPDSQASSSPRNSPAIGDRRSKRLSIFRSRSGNRESGSGDSRSQEKMAPWDASPQHSSAQPAHQVNPMMPRRVEEDASRVVPSKLSKKLQRASTSAKPEPESGKKKRFSAIGVSITAFVA